MWKIASVLRKVALMVLPLSVCQFATGADDEGSRPGATSSVGGRSQQRALLHTSDSLDTVLERINQKSAVLIDVREQDEWDAGHLRGAVFLPLSKLKEASKDPEFQEKITKLSKDKILYCHCKAGGRVLTATPILKSLGFDVRPLKAGYESLLEAGFEKASPKTEASE